MKPLPLSEIQRQAMRTGKWFAVQQRESLIWRVRRAFKGDFLTHPDTFFTEGGAQGLADKLNKKLELENL